MHLVELLSTSPEATRALGHCVGAHCRGGEVLLLNGTLGAGKTCFLQGLARGLGIPEDEPVVSPTFVLHVQYHGRLEFNHLDAYRLADAPDIPDLGLDELYADMGAVTAIEWAELLHNHIPSSYLHIEIEPTGETDRLFRFESVGYGEGACAHLLPPLTEENAAENVSINKPNTTRENVTHENVTPRKASI